MRLMKTEGTVSSTQQQGPQLTVRDEHAPEQRLKNGLETEEASYAWINLDDAKLVKMDAVSKSASARAAKSWTSFWIPATCSLT